jgi:hypothetical protein
VAIAEARPEHLLPGDAHALLQLRHRRHAHLLFVFYLSHTHTAHNDRAMSAGTAKGVRYICFSQKPSVCVLDFWFSLQCPVSCRGEKQRESEVQRSFSVAF